MCLNANGRAAIFLKNFVLINGVFVSNGICTCLGGVAFYRLQAPELVSVYFQKVKTSNNNNYNIAVYAKGISN